MATGPYLACSSSRTTGATTLISPGNLQAAQTQPVLVDPTPSPSSQSRNACSCCPPSCSHASAADLPCCPRASYPSGPPANAPWIPATHSATTCALGGSAKALPSQQGQPVPACLPSVIPWTGSRVATPMPASGRPPLLARSTGRPCSNASTATNPKASAGDEGVMVGGSKGSND
jgi:hypothetical protein